jgi:predicted ester cyclase
MTSAPERSRRIEREGQLTDGVPRQIQRLLGRPFEPAELRRIKRLWVRHSIAEDRRDIEGLIATLAPDCVYEIVPTGQVWRGHVGARAFYRELFAAFPDNAFALREIVIGPQGVFEAATLTGTNSGPWAGAPPSGLPVKLEVLILFPWDPASQRFLGERIWIDRGAVAISGS